ncbi:MAG TPA: dTDP-4-dehydrorhamnose reductase [Kofleriaceae bacterium]|nr:dTDP-4-dehydrorhamnose reductase [Kofleriaceae bacterium]
MRPVLITGSGTLGRAFERICVERGLAPKLTSRSELDITEPDSIERAFDTHQPWLVINAAGYVRVDDAEHDHERCHRENALGPEALATACARHQIPLVTFSSDLVFDGAKDAPYDEHDEPAPLGVYGKTKHEAERRVLDRDPSALVIRTSAFFGPWDGYNFVTITLRELAAGRELRAANDTVVSPTYVPDLVHATLDLAIDGEHGIWHLANTGATTWSELARAAAELAGHRVDRIVPVASSELDWRAPRPRYSALGSRRGSVMPSLADALHRYHAITRERP